MNVFCGEKLLERSFSPHPFSRTFIRWILNAFWGRTSLTMKSGYTKKRKNHLITPGRGLLPPPTKYPDRL
jgi:hypothetical protein